VNVFSILMLIAVLVAVMVAPTMQADNNITTNNTNSTERKYPKTRKFQSFSSRMFEKKKVQGVVSPFKRRKGLGRRRNKRRTVGEDC
jgi:cytochrome oxidase Cu insertion factor (SCO1/SenC/PrrC family)